MQLERRNPADSNCHRNPNRSTLLLGICGALTAGAESAAAAGVVRRLAAHPIPDPAEEVQLPLEVLENKGQTLPGHHPTLIRCVD